ncbi:hypothetical protein J6W34_04795 [bacterium]|nr:hypothetical protein [bacterium]
MSDYQFIKEFTNIKVKDICKKYGIQQSNLTAGATSEENYKKVKGEILRQLLMLFIADRKEDLIVLYLYNELVEKLEKENKSLREMI